MKNTILVVCVFLVSSVNIAFSQDHITTKDSITSSVETFGSISTGNKTPFQIVNGNYGIVPLNANNAYLRGNTFWKHRFNKDLQTEIGADLILVTPRDPAFFVQQLYGSISFKSLNLTIGSKENYHSVLDKNLSSGDFCFSTNARPIPEINLSIPNFTYVPFTKKILQFKGDFAVGKFLENDYILDTKAPKVTYTLNTLLHHKSAFLLLEDPQQKFPVYFLFGFEDCAQWGGWTTYRNTGDLPHSFNDFIKVVLGESGNEDSPDNERDNSLGNHLGTYNFKFGYKHPSFNIAMYKQHYFEDKSGMEFANWRDGIWGIECALQNQVYLKKIVFEYFNTTNQSGPIFHIIDSERPTRGGGSDNYYNNSVYSSGWSYFGKTIGNPLLTSPEYDNRGTLGFRDTRIKAYHLGINGQILPTLSYRLLATEMYGWGDMGLPFLKRKNNFSGMLECLYHNSKLEGWKFGIQFAVDSGTLYENKFGCAIRISKSGTIVK